MHWDGRERDVVRYAVQSIHGMFQWWLVDRDDAAAARSADLLVDWAVGLAAARDTAQEPSRSLRAVM